MKAFLPWRGYIVLILFTFILSSCVNREADLEPMSIASPTSIISEQLSISPNTSTPQPTSTFQPASTVAIIPSTLVSSDVTITAVNGNLFIRRGPGLAYNDVGVLYKDTSAKIIGRDVLSGWVQVNIPNSKSKGWISVQTQFSKIAGDLTVIPDFTFEEWPEPAYIKNCTEHDMYIDPAELYLESLYSNATGENEVQVNPGEYIIYDLFVPGEPEVERVSVREGTTAYITINGLGVKHKCP